MTSAQARRLKPGDMIGILGGGQLGRMLALAAARLGLKAHIFSPDQHSPAFDVAATHTIAAFEDEAALARFAEEVDVVTYEFENVPARTAAVLAEHGPVRPGSEALAASQDRLVEKNFLASLGIETAPFAAVDDAGALAAAVGRIGRPAILKTRRFGYDGKGQIAIREGTDLARAFDSLGGVPTILEGLVNFTKEVSVVAARGLDGDFKAYDVCENHHVNHILSTSHAPARISSECAAEAVACAKKIADALEYVGIIGVEMFVCEGNGRNGSPAQTIKVNEIAPRVHNSGHWTLDGAVTSQFEQHVRAIAGWPLGATTRHGAAVEMRNLIGDEADAWAEILAEPGACLHLYGKAQARPGRKMGHVTRIFSREDT